MDYGRFRLKEETNSYTYVKGMDFRVVRDASSSIQPKKSRPLVETAAFNKDDKSSARMDSVNDSVEAAADNPNTNVLNPTRDERV